ncbi:MAG: RluA family pseudouridine synthase [Gemmataceae bacterium]
MSPLPTHSFLITDSDAHLTLAAFLRQRLPGRSWGKIRQMIEKRRVRINGELCLDPARRVRAGLVVEVLEQSAPPPKQPRLITVRYLDEQVVVVEKPAGLNTVRHPAERDWTERRKALAPTLEDLVPPLIAEAEGRPRHAPQPRLRIVQRLDKETSGLVVFARSVVAERELGRQFHAHTVTRRYLAVVLGNVKARRIATRLVRDRGDGRRGSTTIPGLGKEAITHIDVVERLGDYTLVSCRLETGRTHQIRIHLAEQGHPLCGEKVYIHRQDGTRFTDQSGAPRLALHAAELGFVHPASGEPMYWTMALPGDLREFVERLRRDRKKG